MGIVQLPAKGRQGPPPEWPLPEGCTEAEADAWSQLWASPQAVVWETMGVGCWREVARYCRLLVRTEHPESYAAQHAQATALADRLGLTPKAMRLMLWTIAPDEEEKPVDKTPEVPEDELAMRRRLLAAKRGDDETEEAASS